MAARACACVVGGTGLVGSHLVEELARDPTLRPILAPVRRVPEAWNSFEGVQPRVVDFGALDAHADAFGADALHVCLGTTLRRAGSREAFRRVDHDYVVECARLALAQGARTLLLVSSLGADPRSRTFYLRVKGETEEAVRALGANATYVLRPSILTGERTGSRPGERLGIAVGSALAPLMLGRLRRYRPVPGRTVARAMVRLAGAPEPGFHVVESEQIARLGA